MTLLENCITDLRSANAIIPIFKKQYPWVGEITVPLSVYQEIRKEQGHTPDYHIKLWGDYVVNTNLKYLGLQILTMGPGTL